MVRIAETSVETSDRSTERATQARTAKADVRARTLGKLIASLPLDVRSSPTRIAAELNTQNVPAPRGGTWQASQVSVMLVRLARVERRGVSPSG